MGVRAPISEICEVLITLCDNSATLADPTPLELTIGASKYDADELLLDGASAALPLIRECLATSDAVRDSCGAVVGYINATPEDQTFSIEVAKRGLTGTGRAQSLTAVETECGTIFDWITRAERSPYETRKGTGDTEACNPTPCVLKIQCGTVDCDGVRTGQQMVWHDVIVTATPSIGKPNTVSIEFTISGGLNHFYASDADPATDAPIAISDVVHRC